MAYVRKEQVTSGQFDAMQEVSKTIGEHNDCAVKAVAVVCGVTYMQAHTALELAGRRFGGSTHTDTIHKAVNNLGFTVKFDYDFIDARLDILCNEKNYVVKKLTTRQLTMFPELAQGGNWLLYTNGHVIALKDGEVHCWGASKALHIKSAYRVR